jgi:hypothetical protein
MSLHDLMEVLERSQGEAGLTISEREREALHGSFAGLVFSGLACCCCCGGMTATIETAAGRGFASNGGRGLRTVQRRGRVRRKRNQTATSDFGHSRARVPETPRIAAYPHVSEIGAFRRASAKPLQSRHIRGARRLEPGLIAMQKVVGSNPISRFASNPCNSAGWLSRGKIKPPPHSGDFGRFRLAFGWRPSYCWPAENENAKMFGHPLTGERSYVMRPAAMVKASAGGPGSATPESG